MRSTRIVSSVAVLMCLGITLGQRPQGFQQQQAGMQQGYQQQQAGVQQGYQQQQAGMQQWPQMQAGILPTTQMQAGTQQMMPSSPQTVQFGVYTDPQCTSLMKQGPFASLRTDEQCYVHTYTDPQGVPNTNAHDNFHCEARAHAPARLRARPAARTHAHPPTHPHARTCTCTRVRMCTQASSVSFTQYVGSSTCGSGRKILDMTLTTVCQPVQTHMGVTYQRLENYTPCSAKSGGSAISSQQQQAGMQQGFPTTPQAPTTPLSPTAPQAPMPQYQYPVYKFALYRGTADTKDACGAGGQRGKCFVWDLGAHPNCYKFSETESYSGAVFNETSLTYDLHPRSTDCSSGKGAGRKGTSLGSCTFFSYGGVYWLKLECVLLDSSSVCPADYVECTDCVTGCDGAISPPAPTTPQVPVMPQVPAMPQAPTRPEKAPTKPQGPKTRAETPDVAPAEISSAAYLLVNWSVLVAMAFMSVHAFV